MNMLGKGAGGAGKAAADDIEDSAAPLVEHLAELRTRLIRSVLAFIVGMILCFTIWNPIFNILTGPICDALVERGQNCQLQLIKVQEGFFVAMSISMFGGFILAFPIIAHQMWRFVAPGLYRSEKQAFLPFLIASPVMFALGAVFAYFVVLPLAFDFFLTFQQPGTLAPEGLPVAEGTNELADAGIIFQGSVQEYLSITMKFTMAFGLCFQLPVLLTLMGKAGIISSQALVATRKYAIVAILVLAAVATPPDMMSQLILFAAVYPLYEISIWLIRRIEKRREAELRAKGLWFEDGDTPAAAETATKA
jgi:sec-independent protein translocase protein TatC